MIDKPEADHARLDDLARQLAEAHGEIARLQETLNGRLVDRSRIVAAGAPPAIQSGDIHPGGDVDSGAVADAETHDCDWKRAIIDASVVHWTYVREHESNPRKAVEDLYRCMVEQASDPAISEPAAKLVQRAETAEASLASLTEERNRESTDGIWKRLNEADDHKHEWSTEAWRQWFASIVDAVSKLDSAIERRLNP